VFAGDTVALSNLVRYGEDVNSTDADGYTALHHASSMGYVAIARLLLGQLGATLDVTAKDGSTPLSLARQNEDMRDLLRSHDPTMASVFSETVETASPKSVPSRESTTARVDILPQPKAAKSEDAAALNGRLAQACFLGDEKEVAAALAAGADASAPNTNGGNTPLHWVASRGEASVASLLIKAKADVNAESSDGSRPLHLACLSGRAGVVKALLAAGALPNVVNKAGRTPLQLCGSAELKAILTRAGACSPPASPSKAPARLPVMPPAEHSPSLDAAASVADVEAASLKLSSLMQESTVAAPSEVGAPRGCDGPVYI
jgi:ankyrin repeat protein